MWYLPLRPLEVIPQCRIRSNPWTPPSVSQNKNKTHQVKNYIKDQNSRIHPSFKLNRLIWWYAFPLSLSVSFYCWLFIPLSHPFCPLLLLNSHYCSLAHSLSLSLCLTYPIIFSPTFSPLPLKTTYMYTYTHQHHDTHILSTSWWKLFNILLYLFFFLFGEEVEVLPSCDQGSFLCVLGDHMWYRGSNQNQGHPHAMHVFCPYTLPPSSYI